jgi:hypothetical protein
MYFNFANYQLVSYPNHYSNFHNYVACHTSLASISPLYDGMAGLKGCGFANSLLASHILVMVMRQIRIFLLI